ncbi:glycoside hydrolase family protein [Sphingomonas abietis]|uniref:Right-handed parallel beta-helix repeat-containing protein n=1 Tax=Sphingomonas abietis TaxID=3012344 RepID=A0ABY7NJM7_9SPHN|nr:right-handed parallel beta-helix repeat-containing protein [Sphingomonas abietis]WBO20833.1 right-handed parallel beta-helix repeat-containing protein [Sphingomonas abietis]
MSAPVLDRRRMLLSAGAAIFVSVSPAIAAEMTFTPERFGAKGDGRTDDSDAFARLSDAVNAAGGGTVVLRRTTYLVGTQQHGPDGFVEARLMAFANCRRPLVIRGNGATMKCAPGQRYGMFLPDGSANPEIVRKGPQGMARPYAAMIEASLCSGGVLIQDIELDGNSGALILGGKHGDKGWQVGCIGVALRNNPGPERLVNVNAHHQPHDGIYVDGPRDPTPGVVRQFTGIKADTNGRQGMSIVGGQDYRIENSSFTRTARGAVASAPSAGVDIEAERKKPVRNLAFVGCHFADNRGCAMVADSGDSADVTFTDCVFVGTDNWSVWPNKPGFRFDRCTFAGNVVHPFSDPDPKRATQFTNCLFTDNPAVSPTGALNLRKGVASPLGQADNVLFDHCRFVMIRDGVLPTSEGVIYRDCTMSQRSPKPAATRGRFEGRTVISGPVDLGASVIVGQVTLNGRAIPKSPSA